MCYCVLPAKPAAAAAPRPQRPRRAGHGVPEMKIAINALSAKIGGGVTYIRNMVPRLAAYDPKNEYYVFVSEENYPRLFSEAELGRDVKIIKIRTRGLLSRLWKEQFLIPYYVWREKIGILFSPANITSFFAPCKRVLWIQNIDPFVRVAGEPFLKRLRIGTLRFFTVLSMWRSALVAFSSDFSCRLALGKTRIRPDKTRRVFLGAEIEKFSRGAALAARQRPRVILSVSNISPRKNYEVLIRGYCRLEPELRAAYRLKLVGEVAEDYKRELLALCADGPLRENIIFTGMLSGEALYQAYRQAAIFVLPSLVESFSLPIIEALASGLPVLASNVTCLPEMIGEHGVLFDPCDAGDLARKMAGLLRDERRRDELARDGSEYSRKFSWDETARNVIKLFKELK